MCHNTSVLARAAAGGHPTPFIYTDKILSPYGSLSTSANTGIFSVSFSLRRNSLAAAQRTDTGDARRSRLVSCYSCMASKAGLAPAAGCAAPAGGSTHLVATSGCPLAVMMMEG